MLEETVSGALTVPEIPMFPLIVSEDVTVTGEVNVSACGLDADKLRVGFVPVPVTVTPVPAVTELTHAIGVTFEKAFIHEIIRIPTMIRKPIYFLIWL